MLRAILTTCVVAAFASAAFAADPSALAKRIRLLTPKKAFDERIKHDSAALNKYVEEIHLAIQKFFEEKGNPPAKGVYIAIAIKPNGHVKAWSEAVEGDIPRELLNELELVLGGAARPIPVTGPVAFCLDVHFRGQSPDEFPDFPSVWKEAATALNKPVSEPEQLFRLIWP